MKIAIIGSSGFIGKSLLFFLKKNTKHKILSFPSYILNKNKWIDKVASQIKKRKPEIIINCSGNQNLKTSKKDLINILRSNLFSNIVFINQALEYKNFKGYISFGTKWELGDSKIKRPLNFYAASKKANDVFFNFFSNKKSAIITLKVFDTYGKNDMRKKFLNDLLRSYKNNKFLNITGGKQYLDYININDLIKLISVIIEDIKKNKLKGFKSYTVSSKKPIRLINLIIKLKKILDKELKVKVGKIKYRQNESKNPTKNIFNYPGWKPSYILLDELKKMFDGKK